MKCLSLELWTGGFTPYLHAEVPSCGYSQRRPSTESFRESSEYFRSLSLLVLVCYSTSGLSSRTSQHVAIIRCEDDGLRTVKCVFDSFDVSRFWILVGCGSSLPVHFFCGACAFVDSNQRVERSRCWCTCRQCTSEVEMTGITVSPPGWMMVTTLRTCVNWLARDSWMAKLPAQQTNPSHAECKSRTTHHTPW